MFSARVKFYDECIGEESCTCCMIPVNDFHEAINKLDYFFGENNLIKVDLEHISPDDIITFDSVESMDIFIQLENYIKENVIW